MERVILSPRSIYCICFKANLTFLMHDDCACQDFVHQFNDKAAMRTELMKLVQGLRLPDTSVEEVVANTPDSHLYLHNVGDRSGSAL